MAWAAGIALFLVAVGLVTAARVAGRFEPAARFEVSASRRAAERAIARVWTEERERARELERALSAAERAHALGRSALASEIGRVRATSAWQELLVECHRAAASLRRRQIERARAWPVAAAEARAAVQRAREEVATPGMGAGERAALQRAELALAAAVRSAGAGDLDGALEDATRARAAVEPVHDRWLGLNRRFLDPANLARWQEWAVATVEGSRRRGDVALVVIKADRVVELWRSGRRVATLPVELGSNGLEDKVRSGDRATPEGLYRVTVRKGRGQTQYHRALLIDYPNASDRQRFRERQRRGEVPAGATPGGLIELHGGGGRGTDWTDGCVALTDAEMEWLFDRVPAGAPVTIVGALARSGGG